MNNEKEAVKVELSDELKAQIAAYDPDGFAARQRTRLAQAVSPIQVVLFEEYSYMGENHYTTQDRPNLDDFDFGDAAKCLHFFGPCGSAVTVFDDRDYSTGDDFFIIVKKDDEMLRVGSFEWGIPGWNYRNRYDFFRAALGNLDGKVSSLRFGRQWYRGEIPTACNPGVSA